MAQGSLRHDTAACRRFESVEALEDFMTDADAGSWSPTSPDTPGDILVLGVGGKMGPTLARLAKRAAPGKRVDRRRALQRDRPCARRSSRRASRPIACRPARSRARVEALPRPPTSSSWPAASSAPSGDVPLTWAMNVQVPAMVAEVFAASRIVAFSTGCVYPFVPCGQRRRDRGRAADRRRPATTPIPASAASACSQYFSAQHGTPGRIVPAQLRHRHALRRAARRRPQGARRRADRPRAWAMST